MVTWSADAGTLLGSSHNGAGVITLTLTYGFPAEPGERWFICTIVTKRSDNTFPSG